MSFQTFKPYSYKQRVSAVKEPPKSIPKRLFLHEVVTSRKFRSVAMSTERYWRGNASLTGSRILWRVGVSWELAEEGGVVLGKRLALELRDDWVEVGGQKLGCGMKIVNTSLEFVGKDLLLSLEGEASNVEALKLVLVGDGSTGQSRQVHTMVCVGTVGVTADLEVLWECSPADGIILSELAGTVLVRRVSPVPVLWNLLVSWGPLEVGVVASDGEERLEVIGIKITAWLLSGVVGHEVDDEVVSGGWHNGTSQWWGEVVGVVVDGPFNIPSETNAELVHGVAVVVQAELKGPAETFDAQGVSITVVGVGVVTSNRDVMHKFRIGFGRNVEWSIHNNAYYFSPPLAGAVVPPAAYNFVINFMSNHTAEEPSGYLDAYNFKSFFSITGNYPNFKWTPGYERVPENWYRRHPSNKYGAGKLAEDDAIGWAAFPQYLKIGGNTNGTNTYHGVDLSALTGGSITNENKLDGFNIACLAFQAQQQILPDELKGGINDLHAASKLLATHFDPIISQLKCKPLAKYDTTLFSQFPGYTYSPKDPGSTG